MIAKQLEQTILESSVVVASPDQISSDLGDEAVILNLKSGIYHGLNEVGARVWAFLQQAKKVEEILKMLLQEYDVDPEQCNNDLIALLCNLSAAELISISNETAA
ncbi:PqqD family protein [Dulcicalothrix desertica]|nr:PqqD family protein [Dulcicalothrix desertica]TWH55732.1 coenzyme PQQ synthesis protein D (PqqD) [Dulcicalothrix desertica PCC 7102]